MYDYISFSVSPDAYSKNQEIFSKKNPKKKSNFPSEEMFEVEK
jgi:hypothetical protein